MVGRVGETKWKYKEEQTLSSYPPLPSSPKQSQERTVVWLCAEAAGLAWGVNPGTVVPIWVGRVKDQQQVCFGLRCCVADDRVSGYFPCPTWRLLAAAGLVHISARAVGLFPRILGHKDWPRIQGQAVHRALPK